MARSSIEEALRMPMLPRRRFFINAVSADMDKIGRKLERLEKQEARDGKVPNPESLEDLRDKAYRAYRIRQSQVDQHTGGEESLEFWYYTLFLPSLNKLVSKSLRRALVKSAKRRRSKKK